MGGEKVSHLVRSPQLLGSPPRGRGKVFQKLANGEPARITPAWAGKSGLLPLPARPHGDHPRVGGEKMFFTFLAMSAVGSPPRGRGKEGGNREVEPPAGITPAWAGKRTSWTITTALHGDHPRVGGEKDSRFHGSRRGSGSPPRGRGKADDTGVVEGGHGITPAWAGKRATPTKTGCPGGDHPRVGGEKLLALKICERL